MSFLDSDLDLSGTPFNEVDLLLARRHLEATIERVAPSWFVRPVGMLADSWSPPPPKIGMRPDRYHGCFLIGLSKRLVTLEKMVTPRSKPVLDVKIKSLLNIKDARQFEETFFELEFADCLAVRGLGLDLEPLADIDRTSKGSPAQSPDFGVKIGGQTVYIETTVFRFGPMADLNKRLHEFGARLRAALKVKQQHRTLDMSVPMNVANLEGKAASRLIRQICDNPIGDWEGKFGESSVVVRWTSPENLRPDPSTPHGSLIVFDTLDVFDDGRTEPVGGLGYETTPKSVLARMPSGRVHHVGGVGTHGFVMNLEIEGNYEPSLLKAIKNKLKKKSNQFGHDMPYVLALKFSGTRPETRGPELEQFASVIESDDDYRWISGLCQFIPRVGYASRDLPARCIFRANPLARNPVDIKLWRNQGDG